MSTSLESTVERLHREGFITMAAAAELIRRGMHKATPTRYAKKGVRVNGVVVYLESARVGGALVTSAMAVKRFLIAQNAESPVAAPIETPAARTRRTSKASAAVADMLGAS